MADNAMQSHREAMEFDATMEVIGHVIACYSTKIADEKAKGNPNHTLIEHWKQERKRCSEKQLDLGEESAQGLAKVRRIYGARARALFEGLEKSD